MRFPKSLLLVGFVVSVMNLSVFANTPVTRLYSWEGHALCGSFDAKSGQWLKQVDMKHCGGSEFRFYTWQGHRLCGEFTLKTHEWIWQADIKNCGVHNGSEWTGNGDIPNGWNTSGPAGCASGNAYCNPPEMGGACYCQ